MEILCFFAGMVLCFVQSWYPLCFLLVVVFFRPALKFIVLFFFAIIYGYVHQDMVKSKGMPDADVLPNAKLQGYIASIPSNRSDKMQFHFLATKLDGKSVNAKILLTCFNHCPSVRVGEKWQLSAKIKKPRNFENPGSFDFVKWLSSRHIQWTGYVRHGKTINLSSQHNPYPLMKLREHLADTLQSQISDEKTLGITQALTLGISQYIDKDEWELFRRTGTIHLMVISGAHIGLITGIIYFIMRRLWSLSNRFCLFYPAQKAASILALFAAFLYTLLAGFAVPAERALIVCFFMLLRNFCNQRFTVWQAWRYALITVVVFEPHSVLLPGFYLSFAAVAILLLCQERFPWTGFKKTLAMQTACLFGLMPLTLFWFSYGAVNGLLANLVAIPWVGFTIIPLAFVNLILGQWFAIPGLVMLLKALISILLVFLAWVDSFAVLNLNFSYAHFLHPLAMLASMAILVFLPISRMILIALLLFMGSLFPKYETTREGDAKIVVMDVGQGLAVFVRTAHHQLIYDTGMKFFQGSDMAKLVIIPYLETLGVKKIDKLIISHPDLDHRGGLASLEKKYQIQQLIVDDPKFYKRGVSCHEQPKWVWDGVSFQFFPLSKNLKGKNNYSCVLKIASLGGQILLTGDIEKNAEHYLVDAYGEQLKSSIMLVPHHGSKTSSTQELIQQIAPKHALSSYGYDNRYHFPHPLALLNYRKENIPVYSTANNGMIRILLNKNRPPKLTFFRKSAEVGLD